MTRHRETRACESPRRRILLVAAVILGMTVATSATGTGVGYATARGPAAASSLASMTAPASRYLVLTASSLDAAGLSYQGTFSVSYAAGTADVLRFTLASGSAQELAFTQACTGGSTTVTSAGSALLAASTIDAISLEATVDGNTFSYTVVSPPTVPFPSDVVLTAVTLTATTVSTAQFGATSFTTEAASC